MYPNANAANRFRTGFQPNRAHGRTTLVPEDVGTATHIRYATKVDHPFSVPPVLHGNLASVVDTCASVAISDGPSLRDLRLQSLEYWTRRAHDLRATSDDIIENMSPTVRLAGGHVHVALWQEMVDACEHIDSNIVNDYINGMPVVGDLPPTGLWAPGGRPALQSFDDFYANIPATREKVLGGVKPSEHDEVLFAASINDNTLLGPFYTTAEVDAVVGTTHWTPARRFPVIQFKNWQRTVTKVRPCDDKRRDTTNSATSAEETVRMACADDVAALARYWSLAAPGCQLGLLSADLASAYRQVPIRPDHLRYNIVVCIDPTTDQQVFFVGSALLFGCKSSVPNFCRVTESLTNIMRSLLLLPIDSMVDDFWLIEPGSTMGCALHIFKSIMQLLGFRLEASKYQLGQSSVVLGAHVDLRDSSVALGVSPARVRDLTAEIRHVLETGILQPAHAGKLRGKLQFVSAQVFGKLFRAFLPALAKRQYRHHGSGLLTPDLRDALEGICDILTRCPSRVVPCVSPRPADVVVYTDGYVNELDGKSSPRIGGVIYIRNEPEPIAFTLAVPDAFMDLLCPRDNQIAPIELLAPCVVAHAFPELLRDKYALFFIDNSVAESVAVRGYCRSDRGPDLTTIGATMWAQLASLNCMAWFDRVTSDDNASDGVSRPRYESFARAMGWALQKVSLPTAVLTNLRTLKRRYSSYG